MTANGTFGSRVLSNPSTRSNRPNGVYILIRHKLMGIKLIFTYLLTFLVPVRDVRDVL